MPARALHVINEQELCRVTQTAERTVKVGFTKNPKKVFDEIEQVTAEMMRDGWVLRDSMMEEGLAYVHLFFEKES